jgi:hypothetical protein
MREDLEAVFVVAIKSLPEDIASTLEMLNSDWER